MARATVRYRCGNCAATSLRWVGRCPQCQEFGTMAEDAPVPATRGRNSSADARPARAITEVLADRGERASRAATGLGEFDRVLGGGLVPGQVVLVAGEPGVGKSTLLLAVADSVARATNSTVLYVSGEESAEQIGLRAARIRATASSLLVADETDIGAVMALIAEHRPALVVVDSVQTMSVAEVDGRPGGVAQVLEVTQALTRVAKGRGLPLILVGQSTRENTVAGPRALEHLVDTVLAFEGDRATALRLLRSSKNRYGPADEVVAFEQTEVGLREVVDPSELFRGHRDIPVPGTCVTVTMEGRRALLAEVQALVAETTQARRTVTGLDTTRVTTLAAVTERANGGLLATRDLFVATVGGARITDPGADLAVCLAIASAAMGAPMPPTVIAIGEVALSGDIRPVPHLGQRVSEARRLGFTRILVPAGSRAQLEGTAAHGAVTELDHLDRALEALRRIATASDGIG